MARIIGTRTNVSTDTSDAGLGSHAHAHARAHAHDQESNAGDLMAAKVKPDPVPPSGSPNEAIVWNEIMLQAVASTATGPPVATRAMAIESLAVFNAVSAIEGAPGYLVSLTAPEGASAVAAAAQAAHDALILLFPTQSAVFDAQLAVSLGAIS